MFELPAELPRARERNDPQTSSVPAFPGERKRRRKPNRPRQAGATKPTVDTTPDPV